MDNLHQARELPPQKIRAGSLCTERGPRDGHHRRSGSTTSPGFLTKLRVPEGSTSQCQPGGAQSRTSPLWSNMDIVPENTLVKNAKVKILLQWKSDEVADVSLDVIWQWRPSLHIYSEKLREDEGGKRWKKHTDRVFPSSACELLDQSCVSFERL